MSGPMVNVWWLAAEAGAFLALCLYTNRVNYRHGIWDGAFNHFLPIVRREMLFYDDRRARLILGAEAPSSPDEWTGRCGICGKLPCDYHGHYPVPAGEV